MNEPGLDADWVRRTFQLMLRRPPENDAVVAHYLGLGLTQPGFLRVLMDSEEFMERQRRLLTRADLALDPPAAAPVAAGARVLLFGAFGNGNVGDVAQLAGVAALVRRMMPGRRRVRFATSSWERLAPFAAPGIDVLRPDAMMRPEHIRPRRGAGDGGGADLVVIGGGGLLGAPHFPLHERRWAEWFVGRGVPFALLGVGGSAEALNTPGWHEAYRLLLERAAFVGVRDAETLFEAKRIRADAAWFPDPVLADAMLSRTRQNAAVRDVDAVLIPRAPNGTADRAALGGIMALARAARGCGQTVAIAALEPATDRPALAGEDVAFITRWEDLLALCGRANMVVSARLHGVVAGLASGCAVHKLAQPKTGDLMRRLGLDGWFHPGGWPQGPPDLSAAAVAAFHAAARPGMEAFRADCQAAMGLATAALGSALAGSRRRRAAV